MYVHPTYAVSPAREPLGVLDAWMWVRDREAKASRSLPAGTKESCRWVEGYLRVAEQAAQMLHSRLVYVADREDLATQQNAALAEEAAAASEALQEQASNLAKAVSVFKLNGRQTTTGAQTARELGLTRVKAGAIPLSQKASPKTGSSIAAPQPKRIASAPAATGSEWEQF